MCLILDTNVISILFDGTNKNHQEFVPILNWIFSGRGSIVYGGSKYKMELRKLSRYRKIFFELEKKGKVIQICDTEVNDEQERISSIEPSKDFDDQHIVALILVSKCRIVCTRDKRAHKFLKDSRFYPKSKYKPKIYSSPKNKGLLNDGNIAEICKPCKVLSSTESELFRRFVS